MTLLTQIVITRKSNPKLNMVQFQNQDSPLVPSLERAQKPRLTTLRARTKAPPKTRKSEVPFLHSSWKASPCPNIAIASRRRLKWSQSRQLRTGPAWLKLDSLSALVCSIVCCSIFCNFNVICTNHFGKDGKESQGKKKTYPPHPFYCFQKDWPNIQCDTKS